MTTVVLTPAEALRRAMAAYNAGKFAEAERLCHATLAAEPNFFEALRLLAYVQTRLGRGTDALACYNRVLAMRSDDAALFNNRGAILQALKRLDEALASYEQAIALKPDYGAALYNRGVVLQELKRFEDALASYDRAVAVQPNHAAALNNRGAVLRALKRFEDALASYERILALQPNDVEALNNRGVIFQDLKRFEDALASYDQALTVRPHDPATLRNRGAVLLALKRLDQALASYEEILRLQPNDPAALTGRGNTLRELSRHEQALASYEQALALQPTYSEALNSRGLTLHALKRFEEALASYDAALAVRADDVTALNNRGVTLQALQRFEEALANYDQVLAACANNVTALNNRGLTLHQLKRFDEALACYQQALILEPAHAKALNNQGLTLQALNRLEDALASFDQSLAMRPDYVDALCNRGNTLRELSRFQEAIACYERMMALEPEDNQALNGLAASALKICDWTRQDKARDHVSSHFENGKPVISPLLSLSYSEDQFLHFLCAQNEIKTRISAPRPPLWSGAIWRNDRIKIAYIRGQPMAYLMAELFELHDRSRFEVIGLSFGPDDHSAIRSRLIKAFDQFFDVTERTDREVAQLLNDLRIDIAVDLQGHHQDARPGVFAFRPAPIQVNYLGFPGTTGADFMDYIIADRVVLPFDRQPYYAERIVSLPDCYQVNDRKLGVAVTMPTRKDLGLPPAGFVFCCFNNSWKISRVVFDVWMRLLQANRDSVLWLLSDNKDAENNLRSEAARCGVDTPRLVFATRMSTEEHLARLHVADLFLDTLPVNAHATASHALWAGVPVLTCQGEAFAGRVGASLLNAVGLSELITHSLADYEALALRLARDPQLLRAYRARLAANRLSYPLFDTVRFQRQIEAAYRRMWELWQNGEKPRSFAVPAEAANAPCAHRPPSLK
jgi:protein O-GlcNAc transferase